MRDVPEAWCLAAVGEIADVGTGATPKRGNPRYYEGGTIPWITSAVVNQQEVCIANEFVTEAALEETNLTLYEPGTLLVAMYGEGKTRGKCTELRIQATTNQALAALVLPHSAETSRKWIRYAFEYQYAETRKLASGGVQPNLNLSLVKGIELPFAPRQEQRRIEAAIESYFTRLDDAVATLSRVERNLKRYRASVLKSAVEGRLVPTEAALAKQEGRDYEPASVLLARILTERRRRWTESGKKGKYQEPAPPDTTGLPELPEGWCWATVDQIGDVSGGLTKNAKRDDLSRTLPYLRVANVYANELRLDEIKEIGVTAQEAERVLLRKNDLLVVEGNGSLDQVGRVALWNGIIDPCVHQNHLIKIRFDDAFLPEWALTWLLSPGGRLTIQQVASSTSGLHTLSISKVARLPIPLCPQSERLRISDAIGRASSLFGAAEQSTAVNRHRCSRLRQSILKWAFEGKLADQDPSDEPASVLLERIKAERDIPKSAKKKSRA